MECWSVKLLSIYGPKWLKKWQEETPNPSTPDLFRVLKIWEPLIWTLKDKDVTKETLKIEWLAGSYHTWEVYPGRHYPVPSSDTSLPNPIIHYQPPVVVSSSQILNSPVLSTSHRPHIDTSIGLWFLPQTVKIFRPSLTRKRWNCMSNPPTWFCFKGPTSHYV